MRALLKAWIFLIALTLTAMAVAASNIRFGPLAAEAAIVAAIAGLKASTILRYFLGLRDASRGWRVLFSVYLVILCGSIFAIYAVGDVVGSLRGAATQGVHAAATRQTTAGQTDGAAK